MIRLSTSFKYNASYFREVTMSGKDMGHNGTQRHVIATGYDKNFALLMEQSLEDRGYRMHYAEPGDVGRAAHVLKRHGSVAVVTEYQFNGRGMIGPEVVSTARQADVPVVCVTGYSRNKIESRMFDGVYERHSGIFEEGSGFWNGMRKAFKE